jgi:hypothetical protein
MGSPLRRDVKPYTGIQIHTLHKISFNKIKLLFMWHGTFYIMKANELLKLITVAFSMETLQLNCVLS